jgi:hypothetical protein
MNSSNEPEAKYCRPGTNPRRFSLSFLNKKHIAGFVQQSRHNLSVTVPKRKYRTKPVKQHSASIKTIPY